MAKITVQRAITEFLEAYFSEERLHVATYICFMGTFGGVTVSLLFSVIFYLFYRDVGKILRRKAADELL